MATSTISNFVADIAHGGTGGTNIQDALQGLDLSYKAGDKDTQSSAFLVPGYISSDGKTIWIQIALPQAMSYVTPTVTNLKGFFRGAKGLINSSDTVISIVTNGTAASGYTVTATKLNRYNVRIVITRTTAFTNFQASSDILFQGTWTISFS